MQSISIVGAGRLGGALAVALSRAGCRIDALIYRSHSPVEIAKLISPGPDLTAFDEVIELDSEIVLITAQDPEIASIAELIASRIRGRPFVFHTSGSLSSEILEPLARAGCGTGSVHPLVSISDAVRGSDRFAGAYFCVEGRSDAVAAAKSIVEKLGGRPFSIDPRSKPLYHAAAVTASGHLVALVDTAVEMLSKCGIEPYEAKRILMPLVRSTIENLGSQESENALTGTFARADFDAFQRHIDALMQLAGPNFLDVYLLLGERSVELAGRAGRADEDLEKIRKGIMLARGSRK